MHEVITKFPPGVVIGGLRIAKGNQTVDVTRLRYGSRTRFVEEDTRMGKNGPRRTKLTQTDDFPSDKIANRFISEWLQGIVDNRKYRIIHQDEGFTTGKRTK